MTRSDDEAIDASVLEVLDSLETYHRHRQVATKHLKRVFMLLLRSFSLNEWYK